MHTKYATMANVDGLYIQTIDEQILQNIGGPLINIVHLMTTKSQFRLRISCSPFSDVISMNVKMYSDKFDVSSVQFNISN